MSELTKKRCAPCDGGTPPLTPDETGALMRDLHADWSLSDDGRSLRRTRKFRDFYRTMSFVNALAHIANTEDHHPDLKVGYNHCEVTFTTHAIGGLSQNDFICAAKMDLIA